MASGVQYDHHSGMTVIPLGADLTAVPIETFEDPDDITMIDLGPSGIVPPVAVFHTVAILSQRITVSNGILRINRNFGEYVAVTVKSVVTTFEVFNWPPLPYLGRIMLETDNQGPYTIAWPDWIIWSRGRKPDLSVNGKDRFLLTSVDQGQTVFGDIVGLVYGMTP